MEKKNRQQNGLWFQFRKFRQDVEPGGNPEHKGTEQQIDSENVHRVAPATLFTLAKPLGTSNIRSQTVPVSLFDESAGHSLD
jgi:hypothetical protein